MSVRFKYGSARQQKTAVSMRQPFFVKLLSVGKSGALISISVGGGSYGIDTLCNDGADRFTSSVGVFDVEGKAVAFTAVFLFKLDTLEQFADLSLNSARAVAAGELFDLSDADSVIVSLNGVLES